MMTEPVATSLLETPTTGWPVGDLIEVGEAPLSDLPTPEIDAGGLLLLGLALLLSPNRDGDGGPVEDAAHGYKQDLEFAWSF
jgi:hypothetical protein